MSKDMIKITSLSCENMVTPIVVTAPRPRFSWTADCCGASGGLQHAYKTEVLILRKEWEVFWKSRWIVSAQSAMVDCLKVDLPEEAECRIRVKIRDISGLESEWSDYLQFSTALRKPDQRLWDTLWLSPTQYSAYSPAFRREIRLSRKLIRARVYIAGLGYYQLFVNGQRVGDRELDPLWTDYTKRVLYTAYDVTDMLKNGPNVIGVRLGNGWFIRRFHKAPQFAMRMHLFYEDGSEEWIDSKPRAQWRVTYDTEIRENSIYGGEEIDANYAKPGWNQVGFDMSAQEAGEWEIPLDAEPPGGKLVCGASDAIKVVDSRIPVSVQEPSPGIYVFDAGQNLVGWVRVTLTGKQGQKVTIRHGEKLDDAGMVDMLNLRTATATDTFTLSGKPFEFRPSFTFHGFRYFQVEGLTEKPRLEDWVVEVVHSAVDVTGQFTCELELLNQIQTMCHWTERTNLMGLPTDCPQRDERLGWLNDMTVRAEEAVYNFNIHGLYTKWMNDIKDAQGKLTGAITDTAPFTGFGRQPADPVCSSYLIIPWLLYQYYGDINILKNHYEGLKAWVSYLDSQTEDGIITYSYFGDWASPAGNSIEGSNGCGAVSAITPGALMSTGYLYYNARLMVKIAGVLKKEEDVKRYECLAERTAEAFQEKFFDETHGYYAGNSQASNVFALYLGLVPENRRREVLKHLLKDIHDNGDKFTTGNQCTKYLFDILSENGFEDLAFQIASDTTYPGWGYMLECGATTVWERWENVTDGPQIGMASLNHPMNAVISVWFYKHLCGLRASEAGPGFSEFIVEPVFPRELKGAGASYESVKGTVSISWKRIHGQIVMQLGIPYNSRAIVRLPYPVEMKGGQAIEERKAGEKWEYTLTYGAYTCTQK